MAYMGRGGFSSFGGGLRHSNSDDNRNKGRMYYRGGFFRMYFYIPLDNTYVIFRMIATIIIFAIAGIAFLTAYKPSIVDPIEETKKIEQPKPQKVEEIKKVEPLKTKKDEEIKKAENRGR